MSTPVLSSALQVIVGLGLLNVWLVRARSSASGPVPAAVVAALMVGALLMHPRVKHAPTKYLPALAVLVLSAAIYVLN